MIYLNPSLNSFKIYFLFALFIYIRFYNLLSLSNINLKPETSIRYKKDMYLIYLKGVIYCLNLIICLIKFFIIKKMDKMDNMYTFISFVVPYIKVNLMQAI
jgi:hypothetical protein